MERGDIEWKRVSVDPCEGRGVCRVLYTVYRAQGPLCHVPIVGGMLSWWWWCCEGPAERKMLLFRHSISTTFPHIYAHSGHLCK